MRSSVSGVGDSRKRYPTAYPPATWGRRLLCTRVVRRVSYVEGWRRSGGGPTAGEWRAERSGSVVGMPAHDIVVLGFSAGGIDPLQQLVADLPIDFPASIFVVHH